MNLSKKEEEDKLEFKEPLSVLLSMISKRKELKNLKLDKLLSIKPKEKSEIENKKQLRLKEHLLQLNLNKPLKFPRIRRPPNNKNLMPEDDLYKINRFNIKYFFTTL